MRDHWQTLTEAEYAALPAPEVQLAAGIAMVYSEVQEQTLAEDPFVNQESAAVITHNGDNTFSILPGRAAGPEWQGAFLVTVTREEV